MYYLTRTKKVNDLKHVYKILSAAIIGAMSISCIGGCGKKEEPDKEYNKTIVCTDFTSYDIARRIAEGTDVAVEGIDFGQIDWEKGLSGRDRAKINNSMLFINGTWIDDSIIGGLDEGLLRIQLSDFAEQKENSKDDNRLYTGISLTVHSADEEKNSENNPESVNRPQVVVNPNADKGNGSNEGDGQKNNGQDTNGSQGNNPNSNPENNQGNSNSNGNENNGGSGTNENSGNTGNENGSGSNNGNGNNNWNPDDWKNNGENGSDANTNSGTKEGIRMYFCESSYSAPPCPTDRNGYSLGNYPAGEEILNPSNDPDPYHTWICNRISSIGEASMYFILDNGNGTYTILHSVGWLIERYEVVATVEDIYISHIDNIQNVVCEPSTRDMLGAYSDCFMEGSPSNKQAGVMKPEERIALADTVDFAKGIWLDVKNTKAMAENIKDRLIEIDPVNKDKYEENYKKVDSDLSSLDDKYQLAVDSSKNRTLFIGGAFVYEYMVDAYGIDYVSIYDYSIQENSVPPTRLMNFAELLSQYKIKYIVKDRQSTMDGIESVKSEINHNLNTLIIDTLEYVENWENSSYFDLMEDNYTILKKALY